MAGTSPASESHAHGRISAVILCPLRHEWRAVRRALRLFAKPVRILCTGPGHAALQRIRPELEGHLETDQANSSVPLILAGLAGALTADARVGATYRIDQVISARGESRAPTWTGSLDHLPGASLTTTSRAVRRSEDRRSLNRETGAELVDMESTGFIELADQLGHPWAIVRSISDGVHDRLPEGIDGWINERGGVRTMRILASCAKRPSTLADLFRLQRSSQRALKSLGASLQTALSNTVDQRHR
ncbi:MAG: hypothetical protein EA377_00620 [Phycisphaerales bacterium]|nr:MAG: hypothetical protein EA377_00620 [Phycisphaerales bacterium]